MWQELHGNSPTGRDSDPTVSAVPESSLLNALGSADPIEKNQSSDEVFRMDWRLNDSHLERVADPDVRAAIGLLGSFLGQCIFVEPYDAQSSNLGAGRYITLLGISGLVEDKPLASFGEPYNGESFQIPLEDIVFDSYRAEQLFREGKATKPHGFDHEPITSVEAFERAHLTEELGLDEIDSSRAAELCNFLGKRVEFRTPGGLDVEAGILRSLDKVDGRWTWLIEQDHPKHELPVLIPVPLRALQVVSYEDRASGPAVSHPVVVPAREEFIIDKKRGLVLRHFFEAELTETQPSEAEIHDRMDTIIREENELRLERGLPRLEGDVRYEQSPHGLHGSEIPVAVVGDKWHAERFAFIGSRVFNPPALSPGNYDKQMYRFEQGKLVEVMSLTEYYISKIPKSDFEVTRIMGRAEANFWKNGDTASLIRNGSPGWGHDVPVLHFAVESEGITCSSKGDPVLSFSVTKAEMLQLARDEGVVAGIQGGMFELAFQISSWEFLVARFGRSGSSHIH